MKPWRRAGKKDLYGAQLVNEAIKIEAARVAVLRSCSASSQIVDKDTKGALYAVQARRWKLDPGYFKPMVQAGMANYELGNQTAAEPLLDAQHGTDAQCARRVLPRAHL
jgi:hypothetical protein